MKTRVRTASGIPITGKLISVLAKKAEVGYDVEKTLRRRLVRSKGKPYNTRS